MTATETSPRTAALTICGPNLRDQSKGTFHVHAADCADLKHYGPGRRLGGETGWTVDAAKAQDVAEAVYSDFEGFEDSPDSYLADFHFAPCVKFPQDNPTTTTKEAAVSDQTTPQDQSTPEMDAAAKAAAEKAQAAADKAAKAKAKADADKAKADKAAKTKAEREKKAASVKAEKEKAAAERKAKIEAAKAAKAAEKARKAEERANRPKKIALTLSQRRHIVRLAKAGAKGVKVTGAQAAQPYDYFVEQGLATKNGTEQYKITDAGKARAKDIDAVKYAYTPKPPAKPKAPPAKPAASKPAETAKA